MAGMLPASFGETKEIANAARPVETPANQKSRDAEYQKLAVEAAEKADVALAEKLLSKINDGELRQKRSLDVYGPLVRKALSETGLLRAKTYAPRITEKRKKLAPCRPPPRKPYNKRGSRRRGARRGDHPLKVAAVIMAKGVPVTAGRARDSAR
jgi:hypothetical protein